jgi:hypothetical protein
MVWLLPDGRIVARAALWRTMRGSVQVPSMWNSCVAASISGLRRNSWARKVPRPMAGLMAVATSEAVPALISGTTTTCRSCVSRQVGLALHQHGGVHALHLQVVGAGHALLDAHVAAHQVEGKALAEHVAEVQRQAARQGLQAEHAQQLGQARVGLEELAGLDLQLSCPAMLG